MILEWIKKRFFPPIGLWGERKAADFLQDKSIKVLERNYMAGHDEIDIVAKDRKGLVFVEVRTRKFDAKVPGAVTLGQHKRKALRRCVNTYIKHFEHRTGKTPSWRFDIVEISYTTRRKYNIYHYPGSEL